MFKELLEENPTLKPLENVVEEVAEKLIDAKENIVLLQGYVQSGKTSTFLATIAKFISMGCRTFFIITKNSLTLVDQTERRSYQFFKSKEDEIQFIDMNDDLQELTKYELGKINIFILKKHPSDYEKINGFLSEHPHLKNEEILIIDDESDQASVGFKGKKRERDLKPISKAMFSLRNRFTNVHFLAVTATPYCHFLANHPLLIPYHTVFLPPHPLYFGGEDLFFLNDNINKFIRGNFVNQEEFDEVVGEELTYQKNIYAEFPMFVESFFTFIFGGLIRNYQMKNSGVKRNRTHYSMLIHINTLTKKHSRIKDILKFLIKETVEKLQKNDSELFSILNKCYENLNQSKGNDLDFPSFDYLMKSFEGALLNETKISIINSENPKSVSYDLEGNIENKTPFSIFIGAYAVERGVTFKNLISFVFGRNGKVKAMDTSIQQLRILGARSKEDLRVTRLYATEEMEYKWTEMYKLDALIRKRWKKYELVRDETIKNSILDFVKMALPNVSNKKIKITNSSKIPSPHKYIKANSYIVAKNFDALSKSEEALEVLAENQKYIQEMQDKYGIKTIEDSKSEYFTVSLEEAERLLLNTYSAMEAINDYDLDTYAEMLYVLREMKEIKREEVHIYYKQGRRRSALRKDESRKGEFDDQPHSGQDKKNVLKITNGNPVLLLLEQIAEPDQGFSAPVIWPVLYVPHTLPQNFILPKDNLKLES